MTTPSGRRDAADRNAKPGGTAGPVRGEAPVRAAAAGVAARVGSGAPITPGDVLQLQRQIGNRAVGRLLAARGAAEPALQRMVAYGGRVRYDPAKIVVPHGRIGEWEANLERITGYTPVAITGANLAGMLHYPANALRDALIQKVENDRGIFAYARTPTHQVLAASLTNEDYTLVPIPADMLDTPDDLARVYNADKACVLQALVAMEVPNAELDAEAVKSPAAWHNLYYNTKGMRYDDDAVIYQIYSGLKMTLRMNQPTKWKDISASVLTPGNYVFSMPGHNFGVVVNGDGSFTPRDEPQRRVTKYLPDQVITYVWKIP
ncbi:MAG TPA: hypothetical protein VFH27_10475 [Longimicrobiaceae bacterium]|nr:hypothetical protein [Longimicrobiaceae bacterium]